MKLIPLLLVIVLLGAVAETHAQAPCTYDRCALRIEGRRVLAGTQGERLGNIGPFSIPDLDQRLTLSDSALAHYRIFRNNYRSGTLWALAGGALWGVGYLSIDAQDGYALPVVALTGSVVASVIGLRKSVRAQKALARTVWWYNRDLQRQ